jgi:hypothetical protein
VKSTTAPKLSALAGPAGHLGEPREADDLPAWAIALRTLLDRWNAKYFDDATVDAAFIWQADSHELIAMAEEAGDLPRNFWRLIRKTRAEKNDR